jgi:hypothetical protein
MPYYIKHTDGTNLVTVEDGTVDSTSTSITLVGKNFPTYGQTFNQNLVSILENFANSTNPDPALLGQLWYDSTNKTINFYREGSTTNTWQKIATTIESATAPTDPRMGDLWWDTVNSQLKIYDTNFADWQTIGPQTTNNGRINVLGTNNFQLQVNGNTSFEIDLYGAIKKAYTPCMFGYDNTSSSNLYSLSLTSYNTWVPIESIDRTSNFSAGVFTANSSGIYRVSASVTTLGGAEVRLLWQKNQVATHITARNNVTGVSQLTCSGFISATTGDTIQLVYATDNTNVYISNAYSTYQIEMVG